MYAVFEYVDPKLTHFGGKFYTTFSDNRVGEINEGVRCIAIVDSDKEAKKLCEVSEEVWDQITDRKIEEADGNPELQKMIKMQNELHKFFRNEGIE
jgi:hypothetical protein